MRPALLVVALLALGGLLWIASRPARVPAPPIRAVPAPTPGREPDSPPELVPLKAPARVAQEVVDGESPDERLDPRDLLRVRCVDEGGAPVPRVGVEAHRHGRAGERQASFGPEPTDANGRVAFASPAENWSADAELRVELQLPGQGAWLEWRGPRPAGELVLTLRRGGRMLGHVRRSGGRLVDEDGARLQLEWEAGGLRGKLVVLVVAGAYETPFVLTGELRAAILMSEHARSLRIALAGRVPPGAALERDLVFPLGCDCALTFVDARTRAPLAGAMATLVGVEQRTTDGLGRVAFTDAVDPGASLRFQLVHEDYPQTRFALTCPESAGRIERVLEVEPGFTLAGVVTDERAAPLAGLELRFEAAFGSHTGRRSAIGVGAHKTARTDEDGRFVLRGLCAGQDLRLRFWRGDEVLWGERVDLPGDEARSRWVLSDPVELRGRVLDSRGAPCPAHAVWAANGLGLLRAGETDADGAFALALPPGRWTIGTTYGDPGPQRAERIVEEACEFRGGGSAELVLRLPGEPASWRPASFVLRALDARTGAPLSRYWFLANGIDSTLSKTLGNDTGADACEFTLFAGRFELFLSAEGYAPGRAEVELVAGAEAKPVEVRLAPGPP